MTVPIDDACRHEIRECLNLLDLTASIEVRGLGASGRTAPITVVTQPGLRYAQAMALVESLLCDEAFDSMSLAERTRVIERIRSEIMGRMMEEIVLFETSRACPECEVFKLQFDVGEIDMVVFDPRTASCKLCEIKHSARRSKEQRRHLLNEGRCESIAFRYGDIAEKCVIYRGDPGVGEGVAYLNAEEYLKGLASA